MNNRAIINKLKEKGVKFDKGLTSREFIAIEHIYGFEFPGDIKRFFALALPISEGFYNWRDFSETNVESIKQILNKIKQSFIFSMKRSKDLEKFNKIFPLVNDEKELKECLCDYLDKSPSLIPIYNYDFCFSNISDMPILTYKPPTNLSVLGINLEDWLKKKFLHNFNYKNSQIKFLNQRLKSAGIWGHLIKQTT